MEPTHYRREDIYHCDKFGRWYIYLYGIGWKTSRHIPKCTPIGEIEVEEEYVPPSDVKPKPAFDPYEGAGRYKGD